MVYNKEIKKYVIATDGEEYCKVCKGVGKIKINKDTWFGKVNHLTCHNCYGTGVIDWIEKAMGKKRPPGPPEGPPNRLVLGMWSAQSVKGLAG